MVVMARLSRVDTRVWVFDVHVGWLGLVGISWDWMGLGEEKRVERSLHTGWIDGLMERSGIGEV